MSGYLPCIGAVCTTRRETGLWIVTNHVFDGLVTKCVLMSMENGQIVTRFTHEITETENSTYQNVKPINQYLEKMTDLNENDLICSLDETFEWDETISDNITNSKRSDQHKIEPLCPPKRFKSTTETHINHLKAQNTEITTDRQTNWAVKLIKDWLLETGYGHSNFEWLPVEELDNLLERFYASAQTTSGKNYSKSGLVGIRAGLNRHLTLPPNNHVINLMKDRQFQASNQILTGLAKALKREGKDLSCHKEPIDENDIEKLYKSGVFDIYI